MSQSTKPQKLSPNANRKRKLPDLFEEQTIQNEPSLKRKRSNNNDQFPYHLYPINHKQQQQLINPDTNNTSQSQSKKTKNKYNECDSNKWDWERPKYSYHRPSYCATLRPLDYDPCDPDSYPDLKTHIFGTFMNVFRMKTTKKEIKSITEMKMHYDHDDTTNIGSRSSRTQRMISRENNKRYFVSSDEDCDDSNDETYRLHDIRRTASLSNAIHDRHDLTNHNNNNNNNNNHHHHLHNHHMIGNNGMYSTPSSLHSLKSPLSHNNGNNKTMSTGERLQQMKLAIEYITCSILVLAKTSTEFPKQNELYKWLDKQASAPMTRYDVREARRTLHQEFGVLLYPNSNKLTKQYHDIQCAHKDLKKRYELLKKKSGFNGVKHGSNNNNKIERSRDDMIIPKRMTCASPNRTNSGSSSAAAAMSSSMLIGNNNNNNNRRKKLNSEEVRTSPPQRFVISNSMQELKHATSFPFGPEVINKMNKIKNSNNKRSLFKHVTSDTTHDTQSNA